MKEAYETDISFAMLMKRIFALAFVKPSDIPDCFAATKRDKPRDAFLSQEFADFCNYVHKNYIGTTYEPPLYPIIFWNVFDRVLRGITRSNNSLVAWNRRFGVLCERSHIPFYRLISYLKQ